MDSLTSFCSVILSHRSSSGRKCQVQTTKTSSHSKFSQTVTSKATEELKHYQKQLQGQVRTMLAAMPERTRYRPTADSALMIWIVRHAAWLIPRFRVSDVQSPFYRAMGGSVSRKTGGVWRNSSCTSSRGWKGIWKSRTEVGRQMESGVWLRKSDLTDEHCVRTDGGVDFLREVYDDSQRTAGQERTSSQSSRLHRSRGRRQPIDAADPRAEPKVHEHEKQDEEANDNDGEDEESPDKPDDEDHDMEGETFPQPDTTATSSSSRGEKCTETQENVFLKRRLTTKSPKRPITLAPHDEDPVKRRLVKTNGT